MKMNYFVLGTNSKEKAVAFYDELFEGCGLNKIHGQGRMTLWGNEDFMFALAEPFDGKPASNGNGTMLGFRVDSIDEVNRLHQKVPDLGGMSEGEPGMRSNMHSAYVRDLDNNKICFLYRQCLIGEGLSAAAPPAGLGVKLRRICVKESDENYNDLYVCHGSGFVATGRFAGNPH